MKLTFNSLYLLVCGIFLLYLTLPAPSFPKKPTDSVQSLEEGDVETPLRRAYLTHLTRSEVLDLYTNQLEKVQGILLPTYRLNYPPEDAQTLIRDQTRSTFLEEIVHPFRESIYVNGFEPKDDNTKIVYGGLVYLQQIKIKYVPSNILVRVSLFLGAALLFYFILLEIFRVTKSLFKEWVLTRLHG